MYKVRLEDVEDVFVGSRDECLAVIRRILRRWHDADCALISLTTGREVTYVI